VDLGEAEEIERSVKTLRRTVTDFQRAYATEAADEASATELFRSASHTVYQQVLAPLEEALE
jgi:hypothetical protein